MADRRIIRSGLQAHWDLKAGFFVGLTAALALAACRPTPPNRIDFVAGQWQRIEGISTVVGAGAGVFDAGVEPDQVYVRLEADIPVIDGLICRFCAEVIHLGEGAHVPVSFFAATPAPDDLPPDTAILAISYDRPFDISPDEAAFLIGGPGGADLRKVDDGFTLLKGQAYWLATP